METLITVDLASVLYQLKLLNIGIAALVAFLFFLCIFLFLGRNDIL